MRMSADRIEIGVGQPCGAVSDDVTHTSAHRITVGLDPKAKRKGDILGGPLIAGQARGGDWRDFLHRRDRLSTPIGRLVPFARR